MKKILRMTLFITFFIQAMENGINLLQKSDACTQFLTKHNNNKDWALLDAVRNNAYYVTFILLMQEASLNTTDSYGKNALHYAAQGGYLDILSLLLTHLKSSPKDETWLQINHGDKQILIAKRNFLSTYDNEGKTPLIYTIINGHEECFTTLLDQRADPDAYGKEKKSPLMYAAENARTSMLNKLLALKVNVNHQDSRGYTALSYAATPEIRTILKERIQPSLTDKAYRWSQKSNVLLSSLWG